MATMSAWRMLKPVLALPGVVLVVIPGVLLLLPGGWGGWATAPILVISLLLALLGLAFAAWTARLFVVVGEGTPAPWDPPQKLVVRGPYAHVRNPMLTSVFVMLLAEALAFQSWAIAIWLILFIIANAIYFPLVEEVDLERRFGEDYRRYKANVPRWLPRPTPFRVSGPAHSPRTE